MLQIQKQFVRHEYQPVENMKKPVVYDNISNSYEEKG